MRKQYKVKNKKKKELFWLDLLSIILLFSVHPLVAIGNIVTVYISDQPWFPNGTTQYDFFMYGKMIVFLIAAVWTGLIFLDRFLIRRKKCIMWKQYIPIAIYLILSILSAVCSINKDLSFKGMCEQYETIWVLLGYGIVVFAVPQIVESKQHLHILVTALCVGAFAQGLLGITQIAGYDFWNSEIGKNLLTIGLGKEVRDSLSFTFAESSRNRVYMASYNPNYAGVYVVLLMPIVTAAAVLVKKIVLRLMLILIDCFLLVSLIGSGSKTGIAVLLLLFLAACLIELSGKRRMLAVAVCAAVIVTAGAAAELCGGNLITKAVNNLKKKEYNLHTLEPDGTKVHMSFKKTEIWLDVWQEKEELTLQVTCADGSELPTEWDEEQQCFKIQSADLKNWNFQVQQVEGIYYLHMQREEADWYFAKKQLTGDFAYVTQYGKIDQMIVAPTALPGYERAFSERGYIWGRTLALLPSHFLIGTGADTFVAAFPQSDYVGKYHAGVRMLQELPSKAHSLYLQSALQTGVLSLICLLVFWGWYLTDAVRLHIKLKKRKGSQNEKIAGATAEQTEIRIWNLAILLSVCGYLLMGLLNDSNLATAPLFWGILALGVMITKKYTFL